MKKVFVIAVALCGLFQSCSKNYESKILGTWECEELVVTTTTDGQSEEHVYTKEDDGDIRTMVFRGNDTCIDTYYSSLPVTYSNKFLYSFDGDYLVLTSGSGSLRYKIESLSSSEFVFSNTMIGQTTYDSPEPQEYDTMKEIYTMKPRLISAKNP